MTFCDTQSHSPVSQNLGVCIYVEGGVSTELGRTKFVLAGMISYPSVTDIPRNE